MPLHERQALQLEPGASTRVHTNVQFKRNKANGPNPLSVKKRKRPDDVPPPGPSGQARIAAARMLHAACSDVARAVAAGGRAAAEARAAAPQRRSSGRGCGRVMRAATTHAASVRTRYAKRVQCATLVRRSTEMFRRESAPYVFG